MNFGKLDTASYFTGVTIFLALFFAVIEPASSVASSFWLRLLQWTLQVGIPLLTLIAVHIQLGKLTSFEKLNPWARLTISGIIGSLAFSPIALALDFLFGIENLGTELDPGRLADLWLHEVVGVTAPVTLAWIGINAPRVLGLDFSTPVDPTETAHDREAEPAMDSGFLTTLPPELGHDIVYLKSELHYLRVVTTRGSTLVLFNLRDAIAAMPNGSGLQPHRSYWIALSHTRRLVRQGSSWGVELNSGDTVPVSRRQLSSVKQTLDQYRTQARDSVPFS